LEEKGNLRIFLETMQILKAKAILKHILR